DYHGKTFMDVPMFTGATLREDYVPERCFPPTKQAYTYKSHTKGVNVIRWFPKSAHLFLSGAMDNKVCESMYFVGYFNNTPVLGQIVGSLWQSQADSNL